MKCFSSSSLIPLVIYWRIVLESSSGFLWISPGNSSRDKPSNSGKKINLLSQVISQRFYRNFFSKTLKSLLRNFGEIRSRKFLGKLTKIHSEDPSCLYSSVKSPQRFLRNRPWILPGLALEITPGRISGNLPGTSTPIS